MQLDDGGRFVLLDRLGTGGMAEVWRARLRGRDGLVAIKRILPEHARDGELREMFLREARIGARLDHPSLVRVFDFGESGGRGWMAMELVDGKNLHEVIIQHLKRGRCLPPGLVAYVAERLCRALAYAHAVTDEAGRPLRLVHRDVSPGNVMLSFGGEVKLLDFGIAKLLADGDARTRTGVVKGKSGYMAPERLAELPFDARADLFSVGVFLYEALCGRRLFPDAAPGTVVDARFAQALATAPSHHNPEVPPALDAICRRALAQDREDRFPDGETMAEALAGAVGELGWSAARAARALEELFPRAASVEPTRVGPPARPRATAARRARGRRWAWPLAALPLIAWLALARRAPPPIAKETAAPIAKETAAPIAKETAAPIAKETAAPVVKEAAVPAARESAAAAKHKRPRRPRAKNPPQSPHPLDGSELASPF